ncbi:MAG: phage protein Gp27 family protein [Treponemataceae bacterium]
MPQKSNIDRLDEELRKKLLKLLKDKNITQAQIADAINEQAGHIVISKSGVNRYKLKMDKFIEKSNQARSVADLYVEKLGSSNSNSMGKVLNEQIRIAALYAAPPS